MRQAMMMGPGQWIHNVSSPWQTYQALVARSCGKQIEEGKGGGCAN